MELNVMGLPCAVALLLVFQLVQLEAIPIDKITEAAKTIVEKAADKADQVQPVQEEGGVRATALHTGVNMAIEKGLNVVANKYPAVKLAQPIVQKLAKPAMNAIHSKINDLHKSMKESKKEDATNETEDATTQAPADAAENFETTTVPTITRAPDDKQEKTIIPSTTTTTEAPETNEADQVKSEQTPKGDEEKEDEEKSEEKGDKDKDKKKKKKKKEKKGSKKDTEGEKQERKIMRKAQRIAEMREIRRSQFGARFLSD